MGFLPDRPGFPSEIVPLLDLVPTSAATRSAFERYHKMQKSAPFDFDFNDDRSYRYMKEHFAINDLELMDAHLYVCVEYMRKLNASRR